MLERLEASDEIELSFRPLRVAGGERIVGHGCAKSRAAQCGAEDIVAAAVVEHTEIRFMRAEQSPDHIGINARPF